MKIGISICFSLKKKVIHNSQIILRRLRTGDSEEKFSFLLVYLLPLSQALLLSCTDHDNDIDLDLNSLKGTDKLEKTFTFNFRDKNRYRRTFLH